MVARKAFSIGLILLLSSTLFATNSLTGVICCEEGWVKCCRQDFHQENTAMNLPLGHCSVFPAKCCDIEEYMGFGMPDVFISTVKASATIAAVSTDRLSQNPVNIGLDKRYHPEPRSPPAPIYLQTLSFLC